MFPDYVRKSRVFTEFIESGCLDDDELFATIPEFAKFGWAEKGDSIKNDQDCIDFVRMCEYWQINDLPWVVYDYVLSDGCSPIIINRGIDPQSKFLDEICWIRYPDIPRQAIVDGNLNMLKYSHDRKFTTNCDDLHMLAARNGRLECLKFMYTHRDYYYQFKYASGADWSRPSVLMHAYKMNNVRWGFECHENITKSNACEIAACSGHVDCLACAHFNGVPLTNVCEYAASYGHLECLTWAHEHGALLGNSYEHSVRIT